MPDIIRNKIIFDKEHGDEIFSVLFPKGKEFDFNLLIPEPLYVYQGDLRQEDYEDFGELTWDKWRGKHWGTRRNCWESSRGFDKEKAFFTFHTTWTIPVPIIIVFANRFKVPFEYKFLHQASFWWGTERWTKIFRTGHMARVSKDFMNPANRVELCMELQGWDPISEIKQSVLDDQVAESLQKGN